MDMIPVFLILFSVLAFFFLYYRKEFVFPQDFIPTRWSDFDFWVRKYKETKECLNQLILVSDVFWVRMVMKKAFVGMGASLLSVLLMVKMIFWTGRA